MRKYVLENEAEFKRLEKQSSTDKYDYQRELQNFEPNPNGMILDAGCGSGIVSRYLAYRFPQSKIVGCDFSQDRVAKAAAVTTQLKNVTFQVQDLKKLTYPENHFDAIVCRYVIEHLSQVDVKMVFQEFFRCLKPGGILHVIDIDGYMYNLFPANPNLETVFSKFQAQMPFDFYVGRKLPAYFANAHFSDVTWNIETLTFQGLQKIQELELIHERFENAKGFLNQFLGSEMAASHFVKDYSEHVKRNETVLFYNKFVVSGKKHD